MGVFAPPPILGVLARREKRLARQGPSQHPRGYEKCGLGPAGHFGLSQQPAT